MADVVTPYLDRATFEAMFRPLSSGEALLADLLLKASAVWINERIAEAGRDPLATDDPMAVLVSFEVVRDAMPPMPEMVGRTQYTIQTDDRMETGTLAAPAGLLDFNERHRLLLGLSGTAGPNYGGMDGDFGDISTDASLWAPFGNRIEKVVVGEFP